MADPPSEPISRGLTHYPSEADVAPSVSRVLLSVVGGGVMLLAASPGAEAQEARPSAAIETWAGYAKGWGEDQDGNHAQVGAGMRFYVWPRVSVSPRVRYARRFDTPDDVDDHTELAVEAALTFEFLRPANGRSRMVSPFLSSAAGSVSAAILRAASCRNGPSPTQA